MREVRFALKNTFAIFITYIFIGIAFGILMSEAGYGVAHSTASALFIFAGSLQFVMVPMMASGASLPAIALMTLFINARHLFYGVGFLEKFRRMGRRGPYMVFALTDETYSVLCSAKVPPELDENRASFFIALFDHLYWILGCFLGACAGQFLPFDLEGISFSATAFFTVVVVEQLRQHPSGIPFLIAVFCSALFLLLLGTEGFLVPTLTACLVLLLLLRGPVSRKEGLADG